MIAGLLTFVGSKVGRLVTIVSAVLATMLLAFGMGKREERQKQKFADVEDELEARRKLDEVATDLERDARIERMRRNGNVRKD